MLKCYIIGAVTGLDREIVEAKFKATAQVLKSAGFIPVVPIELVPEESDWHSAMDTCIRALLDSEAYVVQDDIATSKGALLEKAIAVNLDKIKVNLHEGRFLNAINPRR